MDLHISAEHVFIACGYTDMRKSIDGLSAIIAQQFQMDPFQLSFPLLRLSPGLVQGPALAGVMVSVFYKRLEKGEGCSGQGHLMKSGNSQITVPLAHGGAVC